VERQSFWTDSALLTGARWAGSMIGVGVPLVLVRVLTPEAFGVYKQIFLLLATLLVLCRLGLPASLLYFVPRSRNRAGQLIVQSALILGVLGLFAAALILVGRDSLGGILAHGALRSYLPALALIVVLAIPGSLTDTLFLAATGARVASLAVVAFDLCRSVLVIAAAVALRTLEGVLGAVVVFEAVRLGAVVAYVARVRSAGEAERPTRESLRAQLAYALPFAAASLVGMVRDQAHAYYVAGSATAAVFAIYAIGTLNVPATGQLVQSVSEVMLVRASRAPDAQRQATLTAAWDDAVLGLAHLLLPVWAFVLVLAPLIVETLFGAAYGPASAILRVYITLVPLRMLPLPGLLRATADTRALLRSDLLSVAAVAAVLGLAGPRWGTLAAASSVVAGYGLFAAATSVVAARRLGRPLRRLYPVRRLVLCAAIALAAASVAAFLSALVPGLLRLPVAALVMGVAVIAAYVGFGLIQPSALAGARDRLLAFLGRVRAPVVTQPRTVPGPRPPEVGEA